MHGNTRSAALGAIRDAREKIGNVPKALTMPMVLGLLAALLAVVQALSSVMEHIDAIE